MITVEQLRSVLQQSLARKFIDDSNWEPMIEQWTAGLNQFVKEYRNRFGESLDPIQFFDVPVRGAAFFALDTLRLTTEMKIAVWRVLMGSEIVGVELFVHNHEPSTVRIRLVAPNGQEELYSSS